MDNNLMICSNVVVSDNEVVLVPNREVKNVINTGTYRLVIASNVAASANLPVYIQTAIGNIPLICKYGNTIYANQLRTRYNYIVGYGNENENYENGQFVVFNKICPKSTISPTESV